MNLLGDFEGIKNKKNKKIKLILKVIIEKCAVCFLVYPLKVSLFFLFWLKRYYVMGEMSLAIRLSQGALKLTTLNPPPVADTILEKVVHLRGLL